MDYHANEPSPDPTGDVDFLWDFLRSLRKFVDGKDSKGFWKAWRGRFGADFAGLHQLLPDRMVILAGDPVFQLTPAQQRFFQDRATLEHPLLRHFLQSHDSEARRISDFISTSEWLETPLYQKVCRTGGSRHSMGAAIWLHAESGVGLSVDRDCSDFTETERRMLTLLAPHAARMALELLENAPEEEIHKALRSIGLSAREAEVARWMREGKTYREISAILNISDRTVQKHAEAVRSKLRVETRHAAARVLSQLAARPGPVRA